MRSESIWGRRLAPRVVAAVALGLLLGGCESADDEDAAPAACLATSAEYAQALKAAPGQVRLEGDTPISDCLVANQQGGELGRVGEQMIATATTLNGEARRAPTGPEAVQLGYLIGAVQRGADSIHADLVRRLDTAARFSPNGLLPPEFERTFGTGFAAGREGG
jgi:hypothetical protein